MRLWRTKNCMSIETALSAWLEPRSAHTQRQYRSIVLEFCRYAGANNIENLASATTLQCFQYIGELRRRTTGQAHRITGCRKVSTGTVRHKMVVLTAFFELLRRFELIIKNPWADPALILPPKEYDRKRPTERVPDNKVIEMLNACDLTTKTGVRDLALLSVLFGGGLRRSEVVKLRVGDVKVSAEGQVYLELRATKNKRDESQALPEWVTASLSALIAQRRSESATELSYLFVSYSALGTVRGKLSDKSVERYFKRYCKAVGLAPIYSPHSARASAITKLLELGEPHDKVKEFSRHSSVVMVDVYDKRIKRLGDSAVKKLSYALCFLVAVL